VSSYCVSDHVRIVQSSARPIPSSKGFDWSCGPRVAQRLRRRFCRLLPTSTAEDGERENFHRSALHLQTRRTHQPFHGIAGHSLTSRFCRVPAGGGEVNNRRNPIDRQHHLATRVSAKVNLAYIGASIPARTSIESRATADRKCGTTRGHSAG